MDDVKQIQQSATLRRLSLKVHAKSIASCRFSYSRNGYSVNLCPYPPLVIKSCVSERTYNMLCVYMYVAFYFFWLKSEHHLPGGSGTEYRAGVPNPAPPQAICHQPSQSVPKRASALAQETVEENLFSGMG